MTLETPKFRILFVDDEPRVLDGIRRATRAHSPQWGLRFVAGGVEALAELEQQDADVVVTDMRMPGIDGGVLLERIALRHPQTIRIILSGNTDRAGALRAVRVAHRVLAKPIAMPILEAVLAQIAAAFDHLTDPDLRILAAGVTMLPATRAVYVALHNALTRPDASIGDIARYAEQDPALSAKLLQLVTPALFVQPVEAMSVDDALRVLGLDLFRNLLENDEGSDAAERTHSPVIGAEQVHALELEVGAAPPADALTRYLFAAWNLPPRMSTATARTSSAAVAA